MQSDPAPHEPIDSDVDLWHPKRARGRTSEIAVVAVIAAGGAIGASARYLAGLAWPAPSGSLPWATMMINVLGCALIGTLLVLLSEVWIQQRLLRPFLGTGILGGFTTFSTYTVDLQRLIAAHHPGIALIYLTGTVTAALAAVWAAATVTRALITRRFR